MIPTAKRKQLIDKDSRMSLLHQCELLSLSRSWLYYKPAVESEENLSILRFLDEQYLKTPFYGVERLLVILNQAGYHINRKRMRRLMKILDWQTLYPRQKTTRIEQGAHKYPYLLKDMVIDHPNQVWEVDITYIPMSRGFMYLFAIIDVYSRYVVGWSLSNTMNAEWCAQCITSTIATHGVPEVINSDQGSQFTSDAYINCLKSNGIQISMDSKRRAIDNVYIERLWWSVKYEQIYLYPSDNGVELWKKLDEYFHFYNEERPHQHLDYRKPVHLYPKPMAA
jgi:putative transposase